MPDAYTRYEFTEDGSVINPPAIPSYERDLADAASAGDDSLIESVTEDYHKRRTELAQRHNERVTKREQADEQALARDRERQQQQAREAVQAQAEREQRQRAERVRQQEANRDTGEGDNQ